MPTPSLPLTPIMGRKVPVVSSVDVEEGAGAAGAAGRVPPSQPVRSSAEGRVAQMSAVFMELMCADPGAALTAARGVMSAGGGVPLGSLSGMAQRIITELIDDIDGSEATETVRFGLENHTFEIDLNGTNAQNLRDALQPYLTNARRVGGKAPRTSAASAATGVDNKAVRNWAEANGVAVNPRGRIREDVLRQYEAANA